MTDTMVTARMSSTKKDAGNRILESLGSNASRAINELYDYLAQHKALPWGNAKNETPPVSEEELREALAWVDGLEMRVSREYENMSIKDARKARLGLE